MGLIESSSLRYRELGREMTTRPSRLSQQLEAIDVIEDSTASHLDV